MEGRRTLRLILCIAIPLSLSLASTLVMDNRYRSQARDRMLDFLRSDSVYEYSFWDTKYIDSIDFATFHHKDLLSNLSDSSDIALWNYMYGTIKSINPYAMKVPSLHSIALYRDNKTLVDAKTYPIKYGLMYLPYTEKDFERAVNDGWKVLDRMFTRPGHIPDCKDSVSIADIKRIIENRYYVLSPTDTTDRIKEMYEYYRKFGCVGAEQVEDVVMYYAMDVCGFYEIKYDNVHRRREIDFCLILALLLVVSFAINRICRHN